VGLGEAGEHGVRAAAERPDEVERAPDEREPDGARGQRKGCSGNRHFCLLLCL
jgi:hypothetical protein